MAEIWLPLFQRDRDASHPKRLRGEKMLARGFLWRVNPGNTVFFSINRLLVVEGAMGARSFDLIS
ncbi:hypothetical protein [Prochlorococcus sp. MIT 1341]|uniref:hypothetical protein n=1 Tax=Prochlorococcus sp. MIT 1341 TaxID=3096221 RepID=UPI002A752B4F|nr:hypothetical protein [Prochlorococcus sp. MIT 1341]